ncbi:MAG: protein phosphatase 2C domain-containing protein [Lachnospiraceae bacterium]|nr:protein phosphatase 2C domain-containing protein [Lachnospiraceae bacterium]
MDIDHYSYSNPGGRSHNEDAIGSKLSGEKGIFIVADGLGGHKKGELASEYVVESMLEAFEADSSMDRSLWLKESLARINSGILELQKENDCIMKSTAVVLCIEGEKACFGHVGDSRLYYIHNMDIDYITHDHSVAYKKYMAGEISRLDINTDEDQATLLRSLGSSDRYEAEVAEAVTMESGDGFMLCSDGIWEYLHDDEVLVDYLKAEDARNWAERLLLRVIDRVDQNNDNLSVITVLVE